MREGGSEGRQKLGGVRGGGEVGGGGGGGGGGGKKEKASKQWGEGGEGRGRGRLKKNPSLLQCFSGRKEPP